jgi:hypothetical protein
MARTLTNLTPTLYAALDVVSRELTGLIPAVTLDAGVARAAVGETVYSPASSPITAGDVTPGVTPPDDGDVTEVGVAVAISKARRAPVRINGEQQLILEHGVGWNRILVNDFAQAMRVLVNEVEADLAALYVKASRAYGAAATAPFGTAGDYSDAAQVRKILADNGAPMSDLQLVLNTAAGASLRGKQASAQVQGDQSLLRQGVLLDVNGFAIRESAQIATHTAGGAASATTSNAALAVGVTSIPLASAGTGAFVSGDIITYVGDSNKYVVLTGDTDVSDGGTLVIGAPGIRLAKAAATKAITSTATYSANLAFSRDAIVLATRPPAVPAEGDLAVDTMMLTDPVSGLTFEVRQYMQYRQVQYEVSLAWGVAAVKPAHMAILIG